MGEARGIPFWRRRWVRALLLLPLGLALLYLAFGRVEVGALVGSFRSASYLPIFGAVVVGGLAHVVRALRWRIQLEAFSHSVSRLEVLYAVMLGYTVNLVLPRAGEVARCGQVATACNLPVDRAIGTMIGERMADLLASLVLLLAAVAVSYNHFGGFLSNALAARWASLSIGQLGLAVLVGTLLIVACYVVYRIWRNRVGRMVAGILAGIRTLWRTPKRGAFLLYTLLLWGGYWLMTYLVCLALPSTAELPLVASLLLLVVGTFGMIVPVQGGIGSFHVAVALWLQREGIPESDALAYATLSHGAQMLLVLLLTVVLFAARAVRTTLRRHDAP